MYAGNHSMTNYFYIFYTDGRFKSDITGHLGNEGETRGTYSISNDTIFIKPLPKDQQINKYYYQFNEKFIIDGDSCIIDLEMLYDYRKLKPGNNEMYNSKERLLKSISKRKLDR
jgi:hypothetical protein